MYSARCQIKIKTDNQEAFEEFINAIRRDYGDLHIDNVPDDVDLSFDLSFKTEANYETDEDDEE